MKINRQITISFEINEKLRAEKNASLLIENLLETHYKKAPQIKKDILAEILEAPAKAEAQKKLLKFEECFIQWVGTRKEQKEMKDLKMSRIEYFRSKIWPKMKQ